MEAQARFEALYRAHAGTVRTYASRRLDPASADDVVADVFIVAWRRLDEVPADPLPWLLAVARRTLANRRRSADRARALVRRVQSEPARASVAAAADAGLEGAGGDEAVRRALESLSKRDREALRLVAWEGLAPARAALVLGVSANAFSARFSRARRRFRRALATARSETGRAPVTAREEVLR